MVKARTALAKATVGGRLAASASTRKTLSEPRWSLSVLDLNLAHALDLGLRLAEGLNLGLRLGLAWATSGSGSRSKSGSGSSPACRTPLSHAAVLCAERRNHRFQRETKKLRPPYRRRQAGCLFNPPSHPYASLSIHPSIHPSSTPHLLSCESAANLRRSSAARQP